MTGHYDNLTVEKTADALWVRIARPEKRNALSRAALEELGQVFAAYRGDDEVKVAILTGAGDKAFAAGGDLQDFDSVRRENDASALSALASEALDAVREFPVPTVAAVNGAALGGGAELAVACDFRVAAAHATIGYVHARLAITSAFGGGADLLDLLGPGPALLHMLRAEALSAGDAKRVGLIDEVASREEGLDACVSRFIAPIRERPIQVLRALKAVVIARQSEGPRRESLAMERREFARTWSHPDHWEAVNRLLARKR